MSGYVPNILLCGDRAEFFSEIGNRPVKIVGQIEFLGEAEGQKFDILQDGRFSLDGKLQNRDQIAPILTGGNIDFIVFQNLELYPKLKMILMNIGCASSQLLTTLHFKTLPPDNFYDVNADIQLLMWLDFLQFKNLLDYDGHFVKSQIISADLNVSTEMDCIFNENILPIKKNIYRNIYKKSTECRLKHYDAILIEERTPLEFDKVFFTLNNSEDAVITFTKYNSQLYNHILNTKDNFARIGCLRNVSGCWFILHRHKPPEDSAIYVVAHKAMPAEHVEKIPEGYKIIHAGRELSQDLGYIGDNTGNNISYLNPYINEVTAIYWLWQNTSSTIVGLAHYRRFFTEVRDENFAYEKILTLDKANEILRTYDIILNQYIDGWFEIENISNECGWNLAALAKQVISKNLEKFQPEYLDAFESVMNSQVFYRCNMFITRRNVFDAYCRWLFSFFLDSVQEILRLVPLNQVIGKPKRLMGYFAERMVTTWILKNNLRVKDLTIIQTPEL